jgi:TonB dependent receptor/TonB-dependent Receptor Plug Domain/CarboxypepD_reg-like domain
MHLKLQRICFVWIALLLLSVTAQAQKTKFTLYGYVQDKNTGEKLIGATIQIPDSKTATTSNNYGFFSIGSTTESATLLFSHAGYTPLTVQFNAGETAAQTILLEPLKGTLSEVRVVAQREQKIQQQTQMSKINIPVSQIKAMPQFLGEVDVLKTIQLLPGVQQGSEGFNGVYVRGGTPDQNLILLDGTPVYNVSHVFGIFSVFNADAIKNVDLYKGGFPARFGGRLSSVLDISMKDGNMYETHVEGAVGMLAAKLMVEGPIKKGKTSFMISGRRSYLDLLARPILKSSEALGDGDNFGAFFYDLNAKINHIFSPTDRLFFSIYAGEDLLKVTDASVGNNSESNFKLRFGWGNITSTLRWNHIFNKRLFANTTVNYTRYRFLTRVEDEYKDNTISNATRLEYFSGIYDWGFKSDFDYRASSNHSIRFGFNGIYHSFKPGVTAIKQTTDGQTDTDSTFNSENVKATELAVYAEDDWKISNKLQVNAGFHFSGFSVQGTFYTSFQPRFSFRYLLPGNWALKGSYTEMAQFIHLLANNSTNLPTDLWVPSTKLIRPMRSRQVAIGLAKSIWKDQFDFTLEGYYKTMDNVIEYKEGASYFNSSVSGWDKKVEAGRGWTYGSEIMLQKKKGRMTGWVGYTLSWNWRQFKEINQGEKFPFRYDRRHDFELVIQYKLSKRWDISGSWQYSTSTPITLPTAQYEALTDPGGFFFINTVDYIESRNNFRIRAYHRMDIGLTYRKQKKKHEKAWNFSLYNIYNRQNPFYYYFDKVYGSNEKSKLVAITLLPVIPSISYSFKF